MSLSFLPDTFNVERRESEDFVCVTILYTCSEI